MINPHLLRTCFTIVVLVAAAGLSVAAETVKLTIDFNSDVVANHDFAELRWVEGMTVKAAMNAAAMQENGPKFTVRGSGETAFLEAVDGVTNEGGGGNNWIFKVNGKLGDRSFAVKKLSAGDTVLWRFQKYE